MSCIIGIDPGLSGAVAAITRDGVTVEPLPIMANGKASKVKNQVDPYGLAALLRVYMALNSAPKAYIERVSTMPGQGVASNGSIMHSLGVIEGVCAALGFVVVMVQPRAWTKALNVGSDKEVHRATAQRLFPQIDLSRKKDHNLADALLIAHYGKHHGDLL